jgi:phosphopantothenoylcysteine decarboxylase/phosphopantothenate--cysteine ligase
MLPLKKKKIILGVTGSIAAYKAAEIASLLTKKNYQVITILTANATKLISPQIFSTLTRNAVITDLFHPPADFDPAHIAVAEGASLFLIAPATANIIAKLACGIADDALSTTAISVTCPRLIAPAMHQVMYENRVVQENIAKLKKLGYHFVGPVRGRLATGAVGIGRMSEPQDIVAACEKILAKAYK